MEFGKVSTENLSHMDFHHPPPDPRTWLRLRMHGEKRSQLRVGIGCPVWNVKEWRGQVYPADSEAKDFLHHYSRQFNSIELNTTHYRIPDPQTIRKWRDTVPADFRFCPKLLQDVSHRRPLSAVSPQFREFLRSVSGLDEKLGISFLQLPPSFSPDGLGELRRFLQALPADFPIAVEVRHPAFFEDHMLIDPLYDILAKAGAHTVITDVAGRRDVLHSTLTSLKVMVRFIGNDLHPTDHVRIREWVNRLHSWIQLGLEQVEFFVHEPEDRNGPAMVSEFTDLLNEECNLNVRKWQPEKGPSQLGLF
jgi:uncharacterized protein YecE (DUF72 family)